MCIIVLHLIITINCDSQIRLLLHGCLILLVTHMITDQIGLDSVLLP